MTRQADRERIEQIGAYVQTHPGARPADIARELEVPRSSIARSLPNLEEAGYLLSEDNHGRLWPFGGKKGR